MKKLTDCISPMSWVFFAVACSTPMFILLKPTPLEFLAMVFVDTCVFFVNTKIEGRFFKRLYPDTAVYFDGIDDKHVENMSLEDRIDLVHSFLRFPLRRAVFVCIGSYIKVLPASMVVIFYWKHSISNFEQFLLIYGIATLNFCFFYGAIFVESHIFLTDKLRELHEKFDFSKVFERVRLTYSKREFETQEVITLGSIVIFMLGLQYIVIYSGQGEGIQQLAFKIGAIGLIALSLIMRVWYLGRTYFIGGLEKLFAVMEGVDYQNAHTTLPLHTSPLLAQFEKTFNLLNARLRKSEQERAAVVFSEADQSRYRTIGQMSALVAHDLSNPLQAASFYSGELLGKSQHPDMQTFLGRIATNVARASELVRSIKARLRNDPDECGKIGFTEAHQNVIVLLKVQFDQLKFDGIKLTHDQNLAGLILKLSSVDMTHILDNIYRNCIENLIAHDVDHPSITVTLVSETITDAVIHIEDNGTGLTRANFERLTAFEFVQTEAAQSRSGLGLRLTRRLIELNNGSLDVLETNKSSGTTFCLKLKKHIPDDPLIKTQEVQHDVR